jgi:hypothetical protein
MQLAEVMHRSSFWVLHLQTDWGSDLEELGNSWSRFWVFTIAEELFNNLKRSSETVFGHSFQVMVNLGARMFLEFTHVQRVPWQTDNMGWASKAWSLKVGELYLSGRTSVPAIWVLWQYSRWDSEKHCSVLTCKPFLHLPFFPAHF